MAPPPRTHLPLTLRSPCLVSASVPSPPCFRCAQHYSSSTPASTPACFRCAQHAGTPHRVRSSRPPPSRTAPACLLRASHRSASLTRMPRTSRSFRYPSHPTTVHALRLSLPPTTALYGLTYGIVWSHSTRYDRRKIVESSPPPHKTRLYLPSPLCITLRRSPVPAFTTGSVHSQHKPAGLPLAFRSKP